MAEWLNPQEERAWRSFLRAHTQLGAILNRRLQQESDLSHSEYAVLVHLSEASGRALRGFELGGMLQWEKSRLSHQLKRMEGRGLVARSECSKDARGAFFTLTDAGMEAISGAAPKHLEAVRQYFADVLDADQLDALAGASEAIIDAVAPDQPNTCDTEHD